MQATLQLVHLIPLDHTSIPRLWLAQDPVQARVRIGDGLISCDLKRVTLIECALTDIISVQHLGIQPAREVFGVRHAQLVVWKLRGVVRFTNQSSKLGARTKWRHQLMGTLWGGNHGNGVDSRAQNVFHKVGT